VLFKLTF